MWDYKALPLKAKTDSGFVADMSAQQILADIRKDSKPQKVVTAVLNLGDNLPLKLEQQI